MVWTPESYVPVQTALRRLSKEFKPTPKVELTPVLNSYGRVLAQDILAANSIPLFASSHMDGYALRAIDTKYASNEHPITLRLIGSVTLGARPGFTIGPGEAGRVPTGGFLPRGADSVLPLELGHVVSNRLELRRPVVRWSFVHQAGSDLKKGARVYLRGAQLRAQDVGLLIALHRIRVKVVRRPRIAIVPTGSELTDDLTRSEEGKIPNSHSHILSEILTAIGARPHDFGVIPDELQRIVRVLKIATRSSDIVLTIGGSSVGGQDLIERAVGSLGPPGIIAHGIRLDRGRVCGVAVVRGKPVIILPGPVQGMLNAFFVFAYPLVRSISGLPSKDSAVLEASLTRNWKARKSFPHFTKIVYVRVSGEGSTLRARPIMGDTEKMTLLTEANGLVMVPENVTALRAGETVQVHLLPAFSYAGSSFLGKS
jgi:molybdenum cofactor synthesis domain-containing protein